MLLAVSAALPTKAERDLADVAVRRAGAATLRGADGADAGLHCRLDIRSLQSVRFRCDRRAGPECLV